VTPIVTQRLVVRNWQESDRPLFRLINSDPLVMRFFPIRRTADEADRLMDVLAANIDRVGFGFAALELRGSGACIGFCGLHRTDAVPSLPNGAVEIGWRLAPDHQGHGYVTEAAEAWLAHGFETLGLPEIVSFAVWNNERSTAVMRRIGMHHDPGADFDHAAVPDTHPHLRRHVLYRIGAKEWREKKRRT